MGWGRTVGLVAGGIAAMNVVHAQPATEIYRCQDADGRLHYTNSKKDTAGFRKCELVTRQVNVAPSAPKSARSPAEFPRETARDKASAKDRQLEILQNELSAEEAALAKARKALSDQEAVRTGDERNYARVQERLKPFQESVDTHQKNIEALKREIANQYR